MMTRSADILFMTEYIKNVLYFATVRQGKVLECTPNVHYFSIDNELVYENYYSDFGPLNLGCVFRYCKMLNDKLKQCLNKQSIVHYTSIDPKKKANAAFLIGCYGVLYLKLSVRDALKPLLVYGQSYRPFQDATQGDSVYTIALIDCLQAIKKARELNFFSFQDFDYEEYERLDKIQGGDLNWIIPGKFLAFIGPVDYSVSLYHPPEMYIDYFKKNNVKVVIRLNKRLYDGNVFNKADIQHYDLFFPDGSCPPRHILLKFLQISEKINAAIAVHCKAGLGRTGSLIGSYLIKHYRMTAREAIAWMRICRPGSVIGHQQEWLEKLESWLIKQGNLYRKHTFQDTEKFPIHEYGVYSIAEEKMKLRPVSLINKAVSPPPIQRTSRAENVIRPQASRIREAPSKASEKKQYDWGVKASNVKDSSHVFPNSRGDVPVNMGWVIRRTHGEPRPSLNTTSSPSSSQNNSGIREASPPYGARRTTTHVGSSKPITMYPIPSYSAAQNSAIKSLSDARNILLRSSLYNSENPSNSFNPATAQNGNYKTNSFMERIGNRAPTQNTLSSLKSDFLYVNHKRRLGRSPSPSPTTSPARTVPSTSPVRNVHSNLRTRTVPSTSPTRTVPSTSPMRTVPSTLPTRLLDFSRATDTNDKFMEHDSKALKRALSRLKC